MSEMEHKIGVLKNTGKSLKDFLTENNCEYTGNEDKDKELFGDIFYKICYLYGGIVYEIDCKEVDEDREIMNASARSDGNIDFEVRFYNGGCSLNEALGDSLKKMNISGGE